MALAIGNALSPSTYGSTSTRSPAALQAQLAQYQKQLSECTSCSSTVQSQQGQAMIQALTSKIEAVQSQLNNIAATQAPSRPQPVVPAAGGAQNAGSSTADSGSGNRHANGPGRLLDVYA